MTTRRFFVDVETTGLDPEKNGIWQIAGLVEIDGSVIDEVNLLCHPLDFDIIEDKALQRCKVTREEVLALPPPASALQTFKSFLARFVDPFDRTDKLAMIGYNVRFDMDFLRSWFEKQGDRYFGSWFWFPPHDVMGLAADALEEDRAMLPNFQLATVADWFCLRVDRSKTHDALYDIGLTREIYQHLPAKRERYAVPGSGQEPTHT